MTGTEPDNSGIGMVKFARYVGLAAIYSLFLFLVMHYHSSPMIDDAAIYFRYADNIASGRGIVFNPGGPHSYGASSIPYLLILTLVHKIGLNLESAALAINVLSMGGVAFLTFQLITSKTKANSDGLPLWAAYLAAVFSLMIGTVVIWSGQGLECGSHLLICILCVYLIERDLEKWAGVAFAVALIDKLDAISLGIAIVAFLTLRHKKLPIDFIKMFALCWIPWLLIATVYFGNPLPQAFIARTLHNFVASGHAFAAHYSQMKLVFLLGLSAVILVRRSFVQVMTLWFLLYVAMYDLLYRGSPYPWYFLASDYIIYCLAGIGFSAILLRLLTFKTPTQIPDYRQPKQNRPVRYLAAGVAICAFALILVTNVKTLKDQAHYQRLWSSTIETDRVQLGQLVHAYADPSETIESGHGWIQYMSGLKVFDSSGINDPLALKVIRAEGKDNYRDVANQWGRDNRTYIVGTLPLELRKQFTLIAVYSRSTEVQQPEWQLWGRNDSAMVRKIDNETMPLVNFDVNKKADGQ